MYLRWVLFLQEVVSFVGANHRTSESTVNDLVEPVVRQPQWPEFFCRDNKGLFTFKDMCDGHNQCEDGTDECDSMCAQTFHCTSDKKCISLDQFCDGIVDCEDGSDELPPDGSSFSCVNHWFLRLLEEKMEHKKYPPEIIKKCRLPSEMLCDGVNHCGDHSDECNTRCQNETTFMCDNGRCIAAKDRCDGFDDCGDGSDECVDCRSTFRCDDGKCIPLASFCDGERDCADGSDENLDNTTRVFCSNLLNSATQKCSLPDKCVCDSYDHCYNREDECVRGCNSFICDNGKCILRHEMCDGLDNCGDMSDECNEHCQSTFHCDNGDCISIDRFCDGTTDCSDGSDEIYEPDQLMTGLNESAFYCSNILGGSRKKCKLPFYHVCDGVDHCHNRTDECENGCHHSYYCDEGNTCIGRHNVCDGNTDCRDLSDEVKMNKPFPAGRGFQCKVRRGNPPDTKTCILPQDFVLDDVADCEDEADLCGERANGSSGSCVKCVSDGTLISRTRLCDGVFDCQDLSDECLCHDSNASAICSQICFNKDVGSRCICPVGQVPCTSKSQLDLSDIGIGAAVQCIDILRFCDGHYDCANHVDEIYCGRNKDCGSHSQQLSPVSMNFGKTNSSEGPRPVGIRKSVPTCSPNFVCTKYQLGNIWTPSEAIACNGVPECFDLEDECFGGCDEEYSFCAYRNFAGSFSCPNGAIIAGIKVCDGEIDCDDFSKADEEGCPNRFLCESGLIYSIPNYLVCDLQSDCDDESDEMNCNETTHFYCEGEDPDPIYVPTRAKFDGKDDCKDGSDECPSTFSSDSLLSSKEKLIENVFLYGMIWVMGILSVIGNSSVFIYTARQFRENSSKMSNMARIYCYLVLNLAIADMLMGFFLLILGTESSLVSGSYCRQDKRWRSGAWCTALGILASISSETSIAMLAILSTYRLSCVVRPVQSREYSIVSAVMIASTTWIITIVLAVMPALSQFSNYFVSHVWLSPNPYFGANVVKKEDVDVFVKILESYLPGSNTNDAMQSFDWDRLEGKLAELDDNYKILGYFGYYSTHAVCLSKIFVTRGEPAWEYSFVITLMNFLIFIYIVVVYALMWRPGIFTTSVRKVSRIGKSTRKMQKKIAVLVATDFACWVPTCMIAFLRLAGVDIANVVYALAATILLPINSALNPILYSDAIQRIVTSVVSFLICCKRGVKRRYSTRTNPRESGARGRSSSKNGGAVRTNVYVQAVQESDADQL